MLFGSYRERSKIIKRIIFWSVIIGGLIALFFVQTTVNAQPVDPCDALGGCIDGIDDFNDGESTADNITTLIVAIVRFAIFVGGAIAVAFIVLGGYNMMTSNGDSEKYKKGVNTAVYAVLGLALAIVAVTIVSLIGSLLTGLSLDVTPD